MAHLSITGIDADGRIIKYARFDSETEATDHAGAHSGTVVQAPAGTVLDYVLTDGALVYDPPTPPRQAVIDARDLMDRLPLQKRLGIQAATEIWDTDLDEQHPAGPMPAVTVRAMLRDLLGQLYSGATVNLDSPKTIAGANFLAALGLITAAEKTALLA